VPGVDYKAERVVESSAGTCSGLSMTPDTVKSLTSVLGR
jgi:hypothetical protein